MDIGDRLKECRQEARLTQQQVADWFGISRSAVREWESGRARPDQSKLQTLARKFNKSVDYLVTGRRQAVPPEQEVPIPQQVIQNLAGRATPTSRAILERLGQAAEEGRLTEQDLQLLDAIASRIERHAATEQ